MAINYQKVGWDTTKYVNPTNMNKMDNGIKSACDGVDQLNATMDIVQNKLDNKTTTSRDIADSSEGGLLIHHIDGASVQDGTPTPTSPVPIESVSVKVKTQSKNLIPYPYANPEGTQNDVTWSANNDGSINLNGKSNVSGTVNILLHNYRPINELGNVGDTIKLLDIFGVRSQYYSAIYFYDSNNTTLGYLLSTDTTNKEITSDMAYYRFYLMIRNGNDVSGLVSKPMLVKVNADGTYPTTFEKGMSTNANTSLVLRSIGDIKDELIFEDNKYKVLRRIGHHKAVSTDGIYTQPTWDTTGAKGYRIMVDYDSTGLANYADVDCVCNCLKLYRLKQETWIPASNDFVGGGQIGQTSLNRLVFYIKMPTSIDSVNTFKTWLDSNDMYFDYVLNVPTVEELTDDAVKLLGLKSWNEQTHITLDSVVETPITVEYATNNGNGRGINGYTVALANEIKLNQLTMATMLSE